MTMSDDDYRRKRREEWNEAGKRYSGLVGGPLTDLAAQAAGKVFEIAALRSGEAILDVGTGPGSPALEAAPYVGRSGKITGIDFAPSMIAAARRSAQDLGVGNAEFAEMDAEQLAFADNTFDAIISRYAYPHFTNAQLALTESFRVLRPGGRIVAAMHGAADRNPYLGAPVAALTKFQTDPAPITERGPFGLSMPGALEAAMKAAGFSEVAIHIHETSIVIDRFDGYWNAQKAGGAAVRRALDRVPEVRRAEAEAAALASMAQYVCGNRGEFPAQIIIGVGRKH